MKTLIALAFILMVVGCSSQKMDLWAPFPDSIELTRDVVIGADAFGSKRATLPAGTYIFWREDPYGRIYRSKEGVFHSAESVFGVRRTETFTGGLMLGNRAKRLVPLYLWLKSDELKGAGELPRLFLGKQIAEQGYAHGPAGKAMEPAQFEAEGIRFHYAETDSKQPNHPVVPTAASGRGTP